MKLIEYAQMIQNESQNLVDIRDGELDKSMDHHIQNGKESQTDIAEVHRQRNLRGGLVQGELFRIFLVERQVLILPREEHCYKSGLLIKCNTYQLLCFQWSGLLSLQNS